MQINTVAYRLLMSELYFCTSREETQRT